LVGVLKEVSYLREKLNLTRITYIERLVEDKRKKIIDVVAPELQSTPVNLTIYDLIDKLWGHLEVKST